MTRNSIWFFLITSVLIFSCEKENPGPDIKYYPFTYHKTDVKEVGEFRVFTSSGEISNVFVKNKLLQNDSSAFSYFKEWATVRDYMDTVEFIDAEHARLYHEYKNYDFILKPEDDLFVLMNSEATEECCFYGDVFTRSMVYSMGKVKPEIVSEYVVSSTRGYYYFGFNGRNKFVLKKSNGNIAAPWIVYRTGSGQTKYINNLLDADFYSTIPEGDTITLMEFEFLYDKN